MDNSGALNGFIKGGSTSAEQNIIISEALMCFAREHIAAQCWRVASKCNCADGPSRYDFSLMNKKHAKCIALVLLEFLWQIWDDASSPKL